MAINERLRINAIAPMLRNEAEMFREWALEVATHEHTVNSLNVLFGVWQGFRFGVGSASLDETTGLSILSVGSSVGYQGLLTAYNHKKLGFGDAVSIASSRVQHRSHDWLRQTACGYALGVSATLILHGLERIAHTYQL